MSNDQAEIKKLPGSWMDEYGWWHRACPHCGGSHNQGGCPVNPIWKGVPEDDPVAPVQDLLRQALGWLDIVTNVHHVSETERYTAEKSLIRTLHLLRDAAQEKSVQPADERQAFEKWSEDNGLYRHHGLQIKFDENAWAAWQAKAGTKESQPVAHIMPSVLRKLQSSEANGHVYSLPFRSQDEQSVPLYTHSRAEAPVGPNIFSTVNCASAQLGNPVCWIPCGRDECKPAQEKSVQPADERQALLLELLREGDRLMHKAWSAASKLNAEMNLRRSMPKWSELEALTDQRDAMPDWIKRVRAARAAIAPTKP